MADLHSLIRLHKHELDEKRRALAELYSAFAREESALQALDQELEREKQAIAQAQEVSFTFAGYAQSVREKQQAILARMQELEHQITAAKDDLMESFAELKKYEMTQQERDRLAEEERAMRESLALDEVALETFRRREDY